MSYLILQCGSVARGDSNSQSDIDFICIHEGSGIPICGLKKKYEDITFYSVETLLRMKCKGALFITHLDLDGQILDGDVQLRSVVSGFRPAKFHLQESIKASSRFLENLYWYPDSDFGKLWLFDVLYVFLRNIIYCHNALNHDYKFGFVDAIRAFGLNQEQEAILLQVREGKYLFRHDLGQQEPIHPPYVEMNNLERLVGLICGLPVILKNGGVTEWNGVWRQGYCGERMFERAIINREVPDNGFRELLKNHNYNRRSFTSEIKQRIAVAQQVHAADPLSAAPSASLQSIG
ncbi:MAG: hypothetical protein MJK11_20095 [Pseudomonadales bacterium]|nr:hypothetical protein [Pseudomonadales bacterium]